MFTFSEMLALVESESSFGAYVCHRRPGGSLAISDLVGQNFVQIRFAKVSQKRYRSKHFPNCRGTGISPCIHLPLRACPALDTLLTLFTFSQLWYSEIGRRRTHVFRGQVAIGCSYVQAAFLSSSNLVHSRL